MNRSIGRDRSGRIRPRVREAVALGCGREAYMHSILIRMATFAVAACAWLSVGIPSATSEQSGPVASTAQNGAGATAHAKGTFDVKLTPQTTDDNLGGVLDRMSADKQYRGDLDGNGKGQMLAAGTRVKDSAGYVAIERVTGTLQGRSGSFVLLHRGVMNRGAQSLMITVVPDSGTDQLVGLAGTMGITITDGKHFYDFEYTLPARASLDTNIPGPTFASGIVRSEFVFETAPFA